MFPPFFLETQLAFTHCPGNMYISDTPLNMDQYDQTDNSSSDAANIPRLVTLVEEPYWTSVTSASVIAKIKKLEQLIFEDPGNIRLWRFFFLPRKLSAYLHFA